MTFSKFLYISWHSVQFSRSVVSDFLQLHESQHTRPPCPSPAPGIHPNSCPSSRWCHPAISSSVVLFSSCPQSLPASGSFPMSQPFAWGGQSIGVSAAKSVLPVTSDEYPGLISFRMDWLDLLAIHGTHKSLLQHHSSKASILQCSAFFTVQLSHPYMTTGKNIALTRWTFVGKVMSLLFNMLFRLVIIFFPLHGCNHHLQWFWRPPKIKPDTVSTVSSSISHKVMGPDTMMLVFWMLSFKPNFSFSSFTFIKRLFSSSSLHFNKILHLSQARKTCFSLGIF